MITKATELRKQNEVPCVFISEWDKGTVLRSKAVYHKDTDTVEVLQVYDVEGLESLDEEYIEFKNDEGQEERLEVCRVCHEGILRTRMEEVIGKTLVEVTKCSICEED